MHIMPRIEELIDTVSPAIIISLNLAKGYWRTKGLGITAFTTPFWLYEFEVMLFGARSAQYPCHIPEDNYSCIMRLLEFANTYIDDFVVFSS